MDVQPAVLFDNFSKPIALISPEGFFSYANTAFLQLVDLPFHEILSVSVENFIKLSSVAAHLPENADVLPDDWFTLDFTNESSTLWKAWLSTKKDLILVYLKLSSQPVFQDSTLMQVEVSKANDFSMSLAALQQFAVGLTMSNAFSLKGLADLVLESIGSNLNFAVGAFWQEENNVFHAKNTWQSTGVFLPRALKTFSQLFLQENTGLGGRVLNEKAAVFETLSGDDPFFLDASFPMFTGAAFPVILRDKIIGIFTFYSADKELPANLAGVFSTIEQQILLFLSEKSALQESVKQLKVLSRFSELTNNLTDVDSACFSIASFCNDYLADGCILDLYEGTKVRTVVRAASTEKAALIIDLRKKFTNSISKLNKEVMETNTPVLVKEIMRKAAEQQASEAELLLLANLNLTTVLSIPLCFNNETFGVLTLLLTNDDFSTIEIDFAKEIAVRASSILANSKKFLALSTYAAKLQQTLAPVSFPQFKTMEIFGDLIRAQQNLEQKSFYDVFLQEDNTCFFTLGEVFSSDSTAYQASSLRSTIKALALQHMDMDVLLKKLAHIFSASTLEETCSLVCGKFILNPSLKQLDSFTPQDKEHPAAILEFSTIGNIKPFIFNTSSKKENTAISNTAINIASLPEFKNAALLKYLLSPGDVIAWTTSKLDNVVSQPELSVNLISASFGGFLKDLLNKKSFSNPEIDAALICFKLAEAFKCQEAKLSLPCERESVKKARDFVRTCLIDWQAETVLESALLLASEVVTNAIVHAASSPEIQLVLFENCIRVEVSDSSTASLLKTKASIEATGGRGIDLVDMLSTSWGVDSLENGKKVWFELSTK